MHDYNRYGFIEYIMAFAVVFVILFFVSSLVPQNIKSLSILGLIINNLVNILLAVFISLFAVQRYESKRQRIAFIIDLLKQTDKLCNTMKSIAVDLCVDDNKQKRAINVELYCSYAQSLAEYVDAIYQQVITSKKNASTQEILIDMYWQAIDHMDVIGDSVEKNDEKYDEVVKTIHDDALQMLLDFQTHIPKVLASMKY